MLLVTLGFHWHVESINALSPHFFLKPITTALPILVTSWRSRNNPEFHWQTRYIDQEQRFVEKWKLNEAPLEYHAEPDVLITLVWLKDSLAKILKFLKK